MARICCFSAWPAPTIVFFTAFGAYSATAEPGLGRHEERDAPRLAELQRRRGVAVDEGLLDRRLVGRVVANDRGEAAMKREKALGELAVERRVDGAGGDEGERVAARRDDAPAGAAEAGIDAEDANLSGHAPRRSADTSAMPAAVTTIDRARAGPLAL